MELQIGQRWKYSDNIYCVVVQVTNISGKGVVLQDFNNNWGSQSFSGSFESGYDWTYEYLIGQDAVESILTN